MANDTNTSTETPLTFFEELVNRYNLSELIKPQTAFRWEHTEESRPAMERFLRDGLSYYLQCEGRGRQMQWHESYREIIDWMMDNKGYGLLLTGDCGLGKTLITTKVLPVFIRDQMGVMPALCNARELKDLFESGNYKRPCIIVDDIGTESERVIYGNRHDYFAELMDYAEKHNTLLILTTNIGGNTARLSEGESASLSAHYGERIAQRIKALCRPVKLEGKSFR